MHFSTNLEPTIKFAASGTGGYIGDERRVEHRRRILKGATIKFNNGFGNLECTIRNLTSNGARISLDQTHGIPSRIQLHIAGERTPLEALVRWRGRQDIGLSFLLRAE